MYNVPDTTYFKQQYFVLFMKHYVSYAMLYTITLQR